METTSVRRLDPETATGSTPGTDPDSGADPNPGPGLSPSPGPLPAPATEAPTPLRDAGMATAEYAIATLAACGFAGLLVAVLTSDQVRSMLVSIIQRALSVV